MDDYQPIPATCNDGGLKVMLSLSVDKVNPLDYIRDPERFDYGTIDDPIIATIEIHNTNLYPVTFEWVNSPLDNIAGSIGKFRLYCQPLWKHMPVGYVLIERNFWGEPTRSRIHAGETIRVTHVLHLITAALRELADGMYLLRVEGYWPRLEQELPLNHTVSEHKSEKGPYSAYCYLSPRVEVEVLRSIAPLL